jgi:predicted NodU family carbamoyl transferase
MGHFDSTISGPFSPTAVTLSLFMLKSSPVQITAQEHIPAVVHIDGSTRAHTVRKHVDPRFHRLVSRFGLTSGTPVLLNTSLNKKGEPIANTPSEAIDIFLASEAARMIVIENYYYRRSKCER